MAHQQRKRRILGRAALAMGVLASALGLATAPAAGAAVAPTVSPAVYPTDGVMDSWAAADSGPVVPVNDMVTIGNTIFVGGAFTRGWDRERNGGAQGNPFLQAFDATTGQMVPWFLPRIDGPVHALVVTPEGKLLIGGEFTSVNGHADTAGLALLDPTTGDLVPGWVSNVDRAGAPHHAIIREVRIVGEYAYLVGAFSRIRGGQVGGAWTVGRFRHAARIHWRTGAPDVGWRPDVRGKGLWAVAALPDNSRVFLGGDHDSIAGVGGTETFTAVDGRTGAVVPGFRHGLPWRRWDFWSKHGGYIYGLEIYKDKLYVAGAKHYYAIKRISDGVNLTAVETGNDSQRVEVFGDTAYIGCHCRNDGWWFRKFDAATGELKENISAGVTGGDGGWAITEAPDACLWVGGHFTSASQIRSGASPALGNLFRVCRTSGPLAHNVQPVANNTIADLAVPTTPRWITGRLAPAGDRTVVTWAPSTDDSGNVSYKVFRNGTQVAMTRYTRFEDLEVRSGDHTYTVVAFDASGRASGTVAWRMGAGSAAPASPPAVTTLTSVTRDGTPTLSWERDADPSVGYIVKRDGTEVARYNGWGAAQLRMATATNTASNAGVSLAALFDRSVWSGASRANVNLTTDLGRATWIDLIELRRLNSAVTVFTSLTPFTSFDPAVLNRTPGVRSYPLAAEANALATVRDRARYIRIVGANATAAEYIVVSRFGHERVSFADRTAPAGTYTYEVLPYRPHDVVGSGQSAQVRALDAGIAVSVTSPTAGQQLPANTATTLAARVDAVRMVATRVEFRVNGELVGTASAAPWQVAWTPRAFGPITVTATATSDTGVVATATRSAVVVCPAGTEASEDGTCRIWSRGHLLVNETDSDVLLVSRTKDGSFLPEAVTAAKGTTAAGAETPGERLSMVSVNSSATYWLQNAVATNAWTSTGLGGVLVDGSLVTRSDGSQVYVLTNGASLFRNTRSAAGAWSGYATVRSAAGNRVDATVDGTGRVVFGFIENGVARVVTETNVGSNTFTTTPSTIGGTSLRDLSLMTEADGTVVAYLAGANGVSISRLVAGAWSAPTVIAPLAGAVDRVSAELVDGRPLVAVVMGARVLTSAQGADGSFPAPVPALGSSIVRDVDVISNRIGGAQPELGVTLTAPAAGATLATGTATTVSAAVTSVRTTVERVEFLVDGAVVATDTTAPYSVSWTPTSAHVGNRTISARAIGAGAGTPMSATSGGVSVSVTATCIPGVPLGAGEFCATAVPSTELRQVGGNGGNPHGPFDCPSGQVLIGLRLSEAGPSTGYDISQATGLCGMPVVGATGVRVVATGAVTTTSGSAGAVTASRTCGADQVMAGFDAGLTSSGFPDWIRLRCTGLRWDGAASRFVRLGLADDAQPVTPIDVANGTTFDNVDCGSDDVVIGFRTRLGATMDAIQFRCGTLRPR